MQSGGDGWQDGFNPAADKYAVIVGHGRSGTNLTLDLLDQHPDTNCRNEPNEVPGGLMAALPDGFLNDLGGEAFIGTWRDVISRAAYRKSERDRPGRTYKAFYRSAFRAALMEHLVPRTAFRRYVLFNTSEEWPIPRAMMGAAGARRLIPVFKILLMPQWVIWTHEFDPAQHVLHVVRDAAGFINSWYARYVERHRVGPEQVYRDNLAMLDRILAFFGGTMTSPAGYSLESLVESELWRWRYMNDSVHAALAGSPRYMHKFFAELNAGDCAPEIYDWFGLVIDGQTEARLAGMCNTLFPERGKNRVPVELVNDLAAHVLKGSPFEGSAFGL